MYFDQRGNYGNWILHNVGFISIIGLKITYKHFTKNQYYNIAVPAQKCEIMIHLIFHQISFTNNTTQYVTVSRFANIITKTNVVKAQF